MHRAAGAKANGRGRFGLASTKGDAAPADRKAAEATDGYSMKIKMLTINKITNKVDPHLAEALMRALPIRMAQEGFHPEVIEMFDPDCELPSEWCKPRLKDIPRYNVGSAPTRPVPPADQAAEVTDAQMRAFEYAHNRWMDANETWKRNSNMIDKWNMNRDDEVGEPSQKRLFVLLHSFLSEGVIELIGRSKEGGEALKPHKQDGLAVARCINRMRVGGELTAATEESAERLVRQTRTNYEALKQRSGESVEKYAQRAKQAAASCNSAVDDLFKMHKARRMAEMTTDRGTSPTRLSEAQVDRDLREDGTYDPIRPVRAAERFIEGLGKDFDFWGRANVHKAIAVIDLIKQRDRGNTTLQVGDYRKTYLSSIDDVVGRLNQLFDEHLATPDPATYMAMYMSKEAANEGIGIFALNKRPVDDGKGAKPAKSAKDTKADDGGGKAGGGGKVGDGYNDASKCSACKKTGHRWRDGVCAEGIAWAEKNARTAGTKTTKA
jgi:hypothetical protein